MEQAMDLTTHYMGLQLKNPLVASASPLSADLGNIRHLEDSGAAAIVLPSIFEEQIEADRLHKTLAAVGLEHLPEARGHLPDSNQREPQQYLDLIRSAAEAVDIPIIGSLNGTTEEGWISYAKMIEEAGATALELNIYLIPTDISLTGRDVEQRYLSAAFGRPKQQIGATQQVKGRVVHICVTHRFWSSPQSASERTRDDGCIYRT